MCGLVSGEEDVSTSGFEGASFAMIAKAAGFSGYVVAIEERWGCQEDRVFCTFLKSECSLAPAGWL
jgi:hypothetical protein